MPTLSAIARTVRPHQWPKNLAVLAGLFFSPKLLDPAAAGRGLIAFLGFALVAAAVYVFNDLRDREEDRRHPVKCRRPIAAGELSPTLAGLVGLTCASLGLAAAHWLSGACAAVLWLYLAQNVVYTLFLKHLLLVDALTIAVGFVLRVVMGVWAIQDPLTPWIVLCSFGLALFMALGKRSREAYGVPETRAVLALYHARGLDAAFVTSGALAIGSYALFTVLSGKNTTLVVTIPLVVYGVLRYMTLVYSDDGAEDPAELVVRERGMLFTTLLWLAASVAILRLDLRLFDT